MTILLKNMRLKVEKRRVENESLQLKLYKEIIYCISEAAGSRGLASKLVRVYSLRRLFDIFLDVILSFK